MKPSPFPIKGKWLFRLKFAANSGSLPAVSSILSWMATPSASNSSGAFVRAARGGLRYAGLPAARAKASI